MVERIDGSLQFLPVKVRPRLVCEIEFGIGELPEQEIRDPLLSTRADQKVRIRNSGCIEAAVDHRRIDRRGA